MSYGFDDNFKENLRVFSPGIVENIVLKDVSFNKDEEYGSYLEFSFTDKDDTYLPLQRRYYEPKIGGFINSEADLERAITKLNRVIANICRSILGPKYTIVGVKTFDEMARKVETDLKAAISKKILLRAVVVLNNRDYPTLRAFSPVIEPMTKNPTELTITQYDKIVPENKQTTQSTTTEESSHIKRVWDE